MYVIRVLLLRRIVVRGAAKKVFFVARPLRLNPPPLELSGYRNFFVKNKVQEKFIFLSGTVFSLPPPPSWWALKKIFLRLPLA